MSDFTTVPLQTIIDNIPAFEDDGITKRSGLLPADFTVTVWKDGAVDPLSVAVAEIGSSGEYSVTYTPDTAGYWLVEVHVLFNGAFWGSSAQVGVAADYSTLLDRMDRVLGLLHMNSLVDNEVYDGSDQLLSARLRVFHDANNVPSTPGGNETAGLLHEYTITAAYTDINRADRYRMVKVR